MSTIDIIGFAIISLRGLKLRLRTILYMLWRDNIVRYIRSPPLVLVFRSTNVSTYSNPATNDAFFDAFSLLSFLIQSPQVFLIS